MAQKNTTKDAILKEWVVKLLRGIGFGLIMNVFFLVTGSFKGMEIGALIGVVLVCFAYGIGFSYGLFFLKMAWKKAKATFRRSSAYVSMTSGNFILSIVLFFVKLIIGVVVAWIIGLVLCVADLVFALTGRKLLSTTVEEKLGYKTAQPDNIDYEQITRDAVRTNYMTHGTPDAGSSNGRGFTPTEAQVEKAAEKKRYDLSYWE